MFHHPVVGELTLAWDALTCQAAPDQQLVIWIANPDSRSHEGLRFISSWAGTRQDLPVSDTLGRRLFRKPGPPTGATPVGAPSPGDATDADRQPATSARRVPVRPLRSMAALHALEHRVGTGHWDAAATPATLQRSATALNLDGAAYVPHHPAQLTVGRDHPTRSTHR